MANRSSSRSGPQHTHRRRLTRRAAVQAGAVGMLGLGDLAKLRAFPTQSKAKSVLFIFLTGGISQHDSFDMKPDAPDGVRGEFKPISTATPGIQICEHLPLLAQRTSLYSLVRSVATGSNGHELACHMLLTGRLDLPPLFSTNKVPSTNEWPSIPALATYFMKGRNDLPPAIVLPQPSVNEANRFRPGQFAGLLGPKWDAWHVDIAAECALGNGACPHCFRFDGSPFKHGADKIFDTPLLTLPEGGQVRLNRRLDVLRAVEDQQRSLSRIGELGKLDRHREQALSVLTDPTTRRAFDVENADSKTLERYGKNKFGLSTLMGYRLIAAGVNLVQVNLGKNSSWDTHHGNFVNLKQNLLPYFDRCISALLDDLSSSGLLESTLVIVTGEFGRTPKINKNAGRDHWGPVMSLMCAGAGVRGGSVIGASDGMGAYPTEYRQTTENLAATMFDSLGIPRDAEWHDIDGRPYGLYRAEPMSRIYA